MHALAYCWFSSAGEKPWLNEATACTFPEPWISEEDESGDLNESKKKKKKKAKNRGGRIARNTQEPLDLSRFVGDYGHLGFGVFRVFIGPSGSLRYELGTILNGELKATGDPLTLTMTLDEPLTSTMVFYPSFYPDGFPVYFDTDEPGEIISSVTVPYIEFQLPPTFERDVAPA